MAANVSTNCWNRFKRGAFAIDYLVLFFSLALLIISAIYHRRLENALSFGAANLIILVLLIYLILYEKLEYKSIHYWLHSWLPIISFCFYYTQCTSYDNLIFNVNLDPLLVTWNAHIFGNLPYIAALAGQNLLVDEMMHFFYFSYYLVLFIPGLVMYCRHHPRFHEMVFSLTLMMYIHYIVFIFFPADGPIFQRPEIFQRGVLFIPLMEFIYKTGGDQGGGAFPSTHVSTAVMLFLYSFIFTRKSRWLIQISTVGIVLATVYCRYHYPVDVLAGIVTGTIFYYLGKKIYAFC